MTTNSVTRTLQLGRLVFTTSAIMNLPEADLWIGIARHSLCDWGVCEPEDVQANEIALAGGGSIVSVYRASNGRVFWIVTDADRFTTIVLLPSDY